MKIVFPAIRWHAVVPEVSYARGREEEIATATAGPSLDDQHPWPGLAPYDEASKEWFQGRDNEAESFVSLIVAHAVVSLYGKSGLGKSSLLQAGAFPRLRVRGFLPVYARLDFTASISPSDQLLRLLLGAADASGIERVEPAPGEGLWEYLHRPDFELWTPDNHLCTPVLVLDQFEEAFSRGGGAQSLMPLFKSLGDLIENRIPSAIASDKHLLESLDVFRCRYRIVLAFREDYLPDMRAWEPRLPSLLRQWMRLLPMKREAAVSSVERAGHAVIAEGVADSIVNFVASRAGGGDFDATVEPVMLSLCCTRLNRRRLPGQLIDGELLRAAGPDIIDDFYAEAMQGLPDNVHRFVEDHLVQGRSRGSYARDEAIEQGFIDAAQLERLTSVHRLLRVDPQGDVLRIELIHDRLVEVVRQQHERRRVREEDEAARCASAERFRRQVALATVIGSVFVALVVIVLSVYAFNQARSAQAARSAAERAEATAKQALAKANAAAALAKQQLAQRTVLTSNGWYAGDDPKQLDDAIKANEAIIRMLNSSTPADRARRLATTVQIFPKNIDQPRVTKAMGELGFDAKLATPKITNGPTNAVFFGSGSNIEDVKLVVLALIRSGLVVRTIQPIPIDVPGSKSSLIQTGANLDAIDRPPYTTDEVVQARAFTGASRALER
ncbi:hypothetical protein [Paraburkholderia sp. BR10882]|uniref:nSTAND1 domain-containing NTPase n=1 Tax=unclassified Paraburkholderia TaxID=2615204 RepID=UPI0034CF9A64